MRKYSNPIPAHSIWPVKLLSPFRYPGGKTWLVPLICEWLGSMKLSPTEFIEPFAGGGIVGLNVAFRQLADHVTLVELDEDVASVWQTVIYGNAKRLASKITSFNLSPESLRREFSEIPRSVEEKAFQTILRNRVNRGGILAAGAGMLKYGEHGNGIRSRWYPEALEKRILEISKMRQRITFVNGDGLEVLEQSLKRADAVFFIDPPYTAGGKRPGRRLYAHHELDHEGLFQIVSRLAGDFLMTYSNDERVCKLTRDYSFEVREVAMKSTHHQEMIELVIGRDLTWVK